MENVNALVKRVFGSVLVERRQSGENSNWTEVLGSVSSVINSQCGRGKNDVTPYEAVYGQVFDHPFSCTKAEARCCWTLNDRMKVTNEPDFDEYAKSNFILMDNEEEEGGDDEGRDNDEQSENDENEEEEIAYWSDDDLSQEETRSVSDDYFYEHLYNDIDP